MAWIKTIAPAEATGALRKLYDEALRRAGRVFGIVRMMSLSPPMLRSSMDLYRRTMLEASAPLSRRRREMLAVVVSATNDCHY